MRLHRLIAILLLVESRGQIKARELAEALETSVRTIYRDIDTLCEAGIPLSASTGPSGGIHLMEGYDVNMKKLYGDDVINLYLSGIGIRPEGHSDAGLKLKSTLLKLEKSLPSEYSSDIKTARERFYFDEAPWWGDRPTVPFLETIRKSVWQSHKLKIRYGRSQSGASERVVHPYGLVVKSMEWYLAAYCERSSAIKTFKCERVLEAEILDEAFDTPQGFSLEEYWKSSEENFKKERAGIEKYPVSIRLDKYNSEILKGLEVYETRYENNSIFATVNMHKYDFARDEAMEIAGIAEIISPPELREFVVKRLFEIAEVYAK